MSTSGGSRDKRAWNFRSEHATLTYISGSWGVSPLETLHGRSILQRSGHGPAPHLRTWSHGTRSRTSYAGFRGRFARKARLTPEIGSDRGRTLLAGNLRAR